MKKVEVFIDNSNVFKNIKNIRDNGDKSWVSFYDPLELAKKLAGARMLTKVNFYCTRPPSYLLKEDVEHKKKYAITNRYYSTIEKLPNVEVKYGNLSCGKEKNLDTQMVADLVKRAALSEYDTAIIVTNDGDFVSAVQSITELGKKVEVLFFKRKFSMNLRTSADLTRRARKSHFIKINF